MGIVFTINVSFYSVSLITYVIYSDGFRRSPYIGKLITMDTSY